MKPPTKSSFSRSRVQLIERMQLLNFGTIEGLVVRDGEPVLDPATRVVSDVKFGGENGPRPESALDDFVVKAEIQEFFSKLDSLGNGTIRCLKVEHGLPRRMLVEEAIA